MRMRFTMMAALAGLACLGADTPPLAGAWAAGDATLILGPKGGQLQQQCALVTLGPIRPDADGHFTAPGQVAQVSALPPDESADEDVAQTALTRPATVSGEARGAVVTLLLAIEGEPPRRMTLALGERARPVRCL